MYRCKMKIFRIVDKWMLLFILMVFFKSLVFYFLFYLYDKILILKLIYFFLFLMIVYDLYLSW